jgi:hypothetical protein
MLFVGPAKRMRLPHDRVWKDHSDSCTLVYTGKLGSCKSVSKANIIDDLNLSGKNFAVAYFFLVLQTRHSRHGAECAIPSSTCHYETFKRHSQDRYATSKVQGAA